MNFIETGRVSNYAYGHYVRPVQMTRGNRQGNNAFLAEDEHSNERYFLNDFLDEIPDKWIVDKIFDVSKMQMFEKSLDADTACNLKQNWSDMIPNWIACGEYKLPIYLLKELTKHSHYGYNELHLNVLKSYKKGESLPPFKYPSVAKKGK